LYQNAFTSLFASQFIDLVSLEEIDLSNNRLSALPSGIFDSNTRLRTIILSGNLLTLLPLDVFKNNVDLTYLYAPLVHCYSFSLEV
jgi:Leucine-rich repeat (LRR) protein